MLEGDCIIGDVGVRKKVFYIVFVCEERDVKMEVFILFL